MLAIHESRCNVCLSAQALALVNRLVAITCIKRRSWEYISSSIRWKLAESGTSESRYRKQKFDETIDRYHGANGLPPSVENRPQTEGMHSGRRYNLKLTVLVTIEDDGHTQVHDGSPGVPHQTSWITLLRALVSTSVLP